MEQIKKRFFTEAISRYVQLLIHMVIVLITIHPTYEQTTTIHCSVLEFDHSNYIEFG